MTSGEGGKEKKPGDVWVRKSKDWSGELLERKICKVRPEEVNGQWRKGEVKGVWK